MAVDDITKMPEDKVDHVEGLSASQHRNDKAAQVLDEAGHRVILTPEDNGRVLKKIDWHVLPVILGVYFLQALDKVL